jgi:uncharacterized protein YkwD
MTRAIIRTLGVLLMTLPLRVLSAQPALRDSSGPPEQPAARIYDEMRTVYLGNLARRDHGVPPLRWNAQLTEAARWFSWDSVENRPGGYCGHDDTLGRSPWDRVPTFGYRGFVGAENCYCCYLSPHAAIDGWMASGGHRNNLLNATFREVGLGYYRRGSDGRGYVTQDFGVDGVYPPVIINNEALQTTSPNVALYIHGSEGDGGFAGMGTATQMMVANDICFSGAGWEPYNAQRSWTLESGTGWRSAYVKTRDAVGRTAVVSDSIYLGQNLPTDELGLHLASTTTDRVTMYALNGGGLPFVQFSQNWFVDDTNAAFHLWWGNGERVSDPAARGGTAFRLRPGEGESFAWVNTTSFFKETPFVAYVRLKVSDNTSAGEVARFSVDGGGTEYGPLRLKGTDFDAPHTYQEFPLAFTFHDNPDDVFLTLQFWRSGGARVFVDGVYIFTPPQPVQSPLTWMVPGGNYRGGGIWLRYTDGASTFSSVEEANRHPLSIAVLPSALRFLVEDDGPDPAPRTLAVEETGCQPFAWSVSDNAAWLQTQRVGESVRVSVDAMALGVGTWQAMITVDAGTEVIGSPVHVPVTVIVVDLLNRTYLPSVLRH